MNKLRIFENKEFGEIRTVVIETEPYFVASDICKALELSNPTMAVQRLEDDEKAKFNLGLSGGYTNCINEYGLYNLVLASRKKEAKAFKRWITHEVLPSIRKHGVYAVDELLENPDIAIKAFTALKEELKHRYLTEGGEQETIFLTQKQVADYLQEQGILFKMRYEDELLVCANGDIYKRWKNGLYRLTPRKISPTADYIHVSIRKNGKLKALLKHRVIAEAFLDNEQNYPIVNHIDGNRENNAVSNLEWCNQKHNMEHRFKMHSQRYLTNLKVIRRAMGKKLNLRFTSELGIMLGRYNDIENAVVEPMEEEVQKLEKYFGKSIEFLLRESEVI